MQKNGKELKNRGAGNQTRDIEVQCLEKRRKTNWKESGVWVQMSIEVSEIEEAGIEEGSEERVRAEHTGREWKGNCLQG